MSKLTIFKKAQETTKRTGLIPGEFAGFGDLIPNKEEYKPSNRKGSGEVVPQEFSGAIDLFTTIKKR